MKRPRSHRRRGLAYLLDPVDSASLVLFRVAFALILLYDFFRLLSTGEVKSEFVGATFHFTYLGFGWVKPFPGDGTYYEVYALCLAAIFVAAGFCYRISIAVLCLGLAHIFLCEATRFQNHSYLICLLTFLMNFMPLHRSFSIDARLWPELRRDPSSRGSGAAGTAPRWALWLLRFQLGVAYFYGGLAKLNADWLSGMSLKWQLFLDDYKVSAITDSMAVIHFLSWSGMFFDLLVVPALLWRRTRAAAFLAACFFHVVNGYLFDIDIFPAFMLAATTLFFEPDWPRRCLHQLRGVAYEPVQVRMADAPASNWALRLRLAAVGLYMLVQLLFPLRSALYPGNRGWTREGFYFAWTMKLNIYLQGKTTFFVQDLTTGERLRMVRAAYLTPRQETRYTSHPNQVLLVAHDLAAWYRRTRGHDAAVYVQNEQSLNGREMQPSIDPTVDLAAQKVSWRPYLWILPLNVPLSAQMPLPMPDGPAAPGQVWSRQHMHWHAIPGSGRGLYKVEGRPVRFYECPWAAPEGAHVIP